MRVAKLKKVLRVTPRLPANLGVSALMSAPIEGYFNASFLPRPQEAGRIEVVCRQAYYDMDERSFMVGDPVLANTVNALVKIDGGGGPTEPPALLPAFDQLEDIRFFPHDGALFMSAVGYQATPDGPRPSPVVGRVRRSGDSFELESRHATEHVSGVEKNWVFFSRAGRLFIEKFPGMAETYEVEPETLGLHYNKSMPLPLNWSGTKSVTLDGGSLFLDHRRIYILRGLKTVQRYVYRFRYVGADGVPTCLSDPFSLGSDSALTYVSDMVLAAGGEDLLIAVSYDDNRFEIVSLPLSRALDTLVVEDAPSGRSSFALGRRRRQIARPRI
jgi:hypothetical protein